MSGMLLVSPVPIRALGICLSTEGHLQRRRRHQLCALARQVLGNPCAFRVPFNQSARARPRKIMLVTELNQGPYPIIATSPTPLLIRHSGLV